jgi:hypothetical protein
VTSATTTSSSEARMNDKLKKLPLARSNAIERKFCFYTKNFETSPA